MGNLTRFVWRAALLSCRKQWQNTEGFHPLYLNTKSAESISFPHLVLLMMPPLPTTAHFLYCDLEYGISWTKQTMCSIQIDLHRRWTTRRERRRTHIWKHLEDLRGDGKDTAGIHLVPQFGPCRRVLLGGEQKGRSVTAASQRHPSGGHQREEGISLLGKDFHSRITSKTRLALVWWWYWLYLLIVWGPMTLLLYMYK